MSRFENARGLLQDFKGDTYIAGVGVLPQVGGAAARLGSRAVLVGDEFPGSEEYTALIRKSLSDAGVELLGEIPGPAPNAPREDLSRVAKTLAEIAPDLVMSFGGGSTIDVTKAAEVLRTLGGGIEDYFGTGLVTQKLEATGKTLAPHVAIQTAASSGAHLTKYSNITDVSTGQKKLIVDDAIVPIQPVFDYGVTFGAPRSLTADGSLDGIAHCLEVFYGAAGKPYHEKAKSVAAEGIRLVVKYLPQVMGSPGDPLGREALGLATDLGAYAIMIGGTNGGHLTSFSLVDVVSHGRACAIMNPYYTVFFAPAIEDALRVVGGIFKEFGYADAMVGDLKGRELGLAVAEAMIAFQKSIGFPTTLAEISGFSEGHIERALTAAKNPQLKMKLENMPVALSAETVDEYMEPILRAAVSGDLSIIRSAA